MSRGTECVSSWTGSVAAVQGTGAMQHLRVLGRGQGPVGHEDYKTIFLDTGAIKGVKGKKGLRSTGWNVGDEGRQLVTRQAEALDQGKGCRVDPRSHFCTRRPGGNGPEGAQVGRPQMQ